MTLYETIFKRRSVRSYDDNQLSKDILIDIQKYLNDTIQLDGLKARFELVGKDMVNYDKAPHYILAYCNHDTKNFINLGYVLQKTDLYLQSIGLGSVWLGMPKPKENNINDYTIMMAFGATSTPVRSSVNDFKRLNINDVSDTDNVIARAAMLAPSAVNSQPWKLKFTDSKVIINYFGRGILKSRLVKKFSKIDIGIITRHVEVALCEKGYQIVSITINTNKDDFNVEIQYK